MTSDTSSTTPPLRKPATLFPPRSAYAINSTPDGELGSYGCVLLKPLKLRAGGWREGEDLMPGTIIPASVSGGWPIHNRLAMKENKFVRFFLSPDEAVEAGVVIAAQARGNPTRAQVQVDVDEAERRRAVRADNLAKARQAKAERKIAATAEATA